MRVGAGEAGQQSDFPLGGLRPIGVPSLPFDVSDLEALRALADQITSNRATARCS
ncbi:hypothetical protein MAHJHV51_57300 [Mycobacterium avium subsp. hominissuis]